MDPRPLDHNLWPTTLGPNPRPLHARPALTTCRCGHTFGENCLHSHLQHETSSGRRPACPLCKAPIKKSGEDVWRLYAANQEEADGSPGQLRRAAGLEREVQVEVRALEAAKQRVQQAEAALARLATTSSVGVSVSASAAL